MFEFHTKIKKGESAKKTVENVIAFLNRNLILFKFSLIVESSDSLTYTEADVEGFDIWAYCLKIENTYQTNVKRDCIELGIHLAILLLQNPQLETKYFTFTFVDFQKGLAIQ